MKKQQKKQLLKLIISAILLAAAVTINKAVLKDGTSVWIKLSIYIIPYIFAGFDVLKKAVTNIFHGEIFDENFLMALASIGAFFVGECPEAVIIMLFYEVGELFQDVAVENSRDSISSLFTLAPQTANVIRNGAILTVKAKTVQVGELIVVKAGESVPLDGIIAEGHSTFDMSALTGESLPVNVSENSKVLSASINIQNAVTIRVEKAYKDSTASIIQQTVENAVAQKPQVDKFITKFAKYYTPIVVILALVIAVIVPLFDNMRFSEWIYRGLMLLVISCPCALVISVPLGFFISIGKMAKNKTLVKGCSSIEQLKNVNIIAFDKTGTITKGNFAVSEIYAVNNNEDELLGICAAAEKYSNHPIANAICKKCPESIQNIYQVQDIEEIAGKGLKSRLNNQVLFVGNALLMSENGITTPQTPAGTAVHISLGDKYMGYILISDEIKEDSISSLSELKTLGINKTIMLTGDNIDTANAVAQKAGIDAVNAGLLPSEKASIISDLMQTKSSDEKLVFVGDGINDAPSIAAADIGIAMGNTGTDIAIDVADIVIMDGKLSKIPFAINLSRKTMRIITENIAFSLLIKAVIFVLSIVGLSNMWFAIFADVGSLILAILNVLRINK